MAEACDAGPHRNAWRADGGCHVCRDGFDPDDEPRARNGVNELMPGEAVAQVDAAGQAARDFGDPAGLLRASPREREPVAISAEALGELPPLCGRPVAQWRAGSHMDDEVVVGAQPRLA
jgi:hypothetical protein